MKTIHLSIIISLTLITSISGQGDKAWLKNIKFLQTSIIEHESYKFEFLDSLMQHWPVINTFSYADKIRYFSTSKQATKYGYPMREKPYFLTGNASVIHGTPYGTGEPIHPNIQAAIDYCGIAVSLLERQYIESTYPYKITFSESFLFNLELLNIQEEENVLLYRNGDGIIAWLYHLLHPKSSFTMATNEWSNQQYLINRYADYPTLNTHLGNYNNTKLPKKSFDKIILLHKCSGFNRTTKFIKSAYETLKSKGKVFLFEPDFGGDCTTCKSTKKLDNFIRKWTNEGFTLIRVDHLSCGTFIEFQKS